MREIDKLAELIRPRDVFLDIGANEGPFTARALKETNNQCYIYSFEPHIEQYNDLYNRFYDYPEVKTYNVAVGDENTEVLLFYKIGDKHGNKYGASTIIPELVTKRRLSNNIGEQKVKMITIDSLNLNPNIMKIDVEGAEAKVLIGAKNTILRSRPIIIMEYGQGGPEHFFPKSIDILKEYGYKKLINIEEGCEFNYPDFCNVLAIHEN
jgi:FkbM family methyltransferase